MKILFVRHADPDYEKDSLTEKGFREAALLVPRMERLPIDACYVSSMGRAQATAKGFLEKKQITPVICDWLREFDHPVQLEDGSWFHIPWDQLPGEWMLEERYFQKDAWSGTKRMKSGRIEEYAREVTESFDALLKEHGYAREGNYYRVERANTDTLVFVCHFGVIAVLLGHMLGISPMCIWHGFSAPPSSVTLLYTEERQKGIANFRMNYYGDISHLYVANEPPSFTPRFCECYDNWEERHD